MKLASLVFVLTLLTVSRCDIPNVFEFCSALMSDSRSTPTSCTSGTTCQGRPGKRGIAGPAGQKGETGDQGLSGSTEDLENKIARLEDFMSIVLSADITGNTAMSELKEAYCAMGMKSRAIPDSAIDVSRDITASFRGKYGRLDEQATRPNGWRNGESYGCWHATPSRVSEWFQVDLGEPKWVAGIVTQGRPQTYIAQWVTSYKVSCGNSTVSWVTIGQDQVFQANRDRSTKVVNLFPAVAKCRYIRIYPQTWNGAMVLRVEILRGECM